MQNIELRLGALSPSIKEQLAEQGYSTGQAAVFQGIADALCTLRIQGYLSKAIHDQSCRRLINAVAKSARPLNVEGPRP